MANDVTIVTLFLGTQNESHTVAFIYMHSIRGEATTWHTDKKVANRRITERS